jgi:hypothetical protein
MDNNDISIEGNIATWRMSPMEGEIGGTYTGTFTFRCFLDPIRQLQAGREYREFLGSHAIGASEFEGRIAFSLSQLKHRVITAPPFWTSTQQDSGMNGNIGDINIIFWVLDAAIRSEELYKDRMLKEREEILNRTIKKTEQTIKEENKNE